ncbi:hypothetical protein [Phormidesmis sp. 146-33]
MDNYAASFTGSVVRLLSLTMLCPKKRSGVAEFTCGALGSSISESQLNPYN